ncbi:hypothetical protein V8F06_002578 [Rhypophila decipiens]
MKEPTKRATPPEWLKIFQFLPSILPCILARYNESPRWCVSVIGCTQTRRRVMERLEARWNISRSFWALVGHHLMQVQPVSVHLFSLWNNMTKTEELDNRDVVIIHALLAHQVLSPYQPERILLVIQKRRQEIHDRLADDKEVQAGVTIIVKFFTLQSSFCSTIWDSYDLLFYHACQTSWIIRKLKYFEVGAYMYSVQAFISLGCTQELCPLPWDLELGVISVGIQLRTSALFD